jgi:hypothetical protein
MPAKHVDVQAVMNTHLSQPTGAGSFDGQHGISPAISSVATDDDMSSTSMEASEDVAAIKGRETGANARPAMTRIASSRRMVNLHFTCLVSHKLGTMESYPIQ